MFSQALPIEEIVFPDKVVFPEAVFDGMSWKSKQVPEEFYGYLKQRKFDDAAQCLSKSDIQFYQGYRLLCNSPEALAKYLLLESDKVTMSPAARSIICHLYIQLQCYMYTTLRAYYTVRNLDLWRLELQEYIRQKRHLLNKELVFSYLKVFGDITLIMDVGKALGDLETVVKTVSVEDSDHKTYDDHIKMAIETSTEDQRQFLMRYSKKNKGEYYLYNVYDYNNMIPMDALYDSFVHLIQTCQSLNSQNHILTIIEEYQKTFNIPAYHHLYIIGQVMHNRAKARETVNAFCDTPAFDMIDKDYIVEWMLGYESTIQHMEGMYFDRYALAADIYSRVESRHVLAVVYSLKDWLEKYRLYKKRDAVFALFTKTMTEGTGSLTEDTRDKYFSLLQTSDVSEEEAKWRDACQANFCTNHSKFLSAGIVPDIPAVGPTKPEILKRAIELLNQFEDNNVKDTKDCWIELFRLCHTRAVRVQTNGEQAEVDEHDDILPDLFSEKTGGDTDVWTVLIKAAGKSCFITFNDVFDFIPSSKRLRSMFASIAESVGSITEFMNDSKEMRVRIEERMQVHRSRLNDLSTDRRPVSVNPANKSCFICSRAICDEPMSVFLKCGHVSHQRCCQNEGITSCPECGLSAIDMMDRPFVDPEKSLMISHWSLHDL